MSTVISTKMPIDTDMVKLRARLKKLAKKQGFITAKKQGNINALLCSTINKLANDKTNPTAKA